MRRQARVSSDATIDVQITLSMASEVDGAWGDVNVHQIIYDSALNVVKHTIYQISLAHLHYFNI